MFQATNNKYNIINYCIMDISSFLQNILKAGPKFIMIIFLIVVLGIITFVKDLNPLFLIIVILASSPTLIVGVDKIIRK